MAALLDEPPEDWAHLRKGAMFGCPGYFAGTKAVACVYGDTLSLTLPQDRIAVLLGLTGLPPLHRARAGDERLGAD